MPGTEHPQDETTPPKRIRRRWRILGSLALMAFSTLIALLIAEMVVRLVAPQQLIEYRSDVYSAVDVYGHQHTPLADTRVNTGERTVRFMSDADGFRIGEQGRGDGEPVLLLLGDSFLQALQVEYEQSYAGLLESRLPERMGRPLTVRNTGVAGWNVNHYLLRARESLAEERSAAVVVSITIENDLVHERVESYAPRETTLFHDFRLPKNLSAAELIDAIAYPINDRLEVRSHGFILARRQLHTIRMRFGLSPLNIPAHFYRSEAASPAWQTTVDALAELASVAGEHGVPVMFLLLPGDYQVHPDALDDLARGLGLDPESLDMDQPNRILNELMRERGLYVLDALPALREAAARGLRLYGRVDPHLSPEGHEVVYRLLEEPVLRMLRESTPDAAAAE